MSEHSREHEELLIALLAGDRRESEPEVAARLRDCERCREEWSTLRDSAARLEELVVERRAALAELARAAPAPGEERVHATLARLAGADAQRGRRRALAALAAAALLVAGAWLAFRLLAREPERTWLGAEELQLVAPSGAVAGFERFSWTYAGDGADAFAVRVYELLDEGRGRLVLERARWKETTWTPDAADLEALPDRIEWEVDVLDEFRFPIASASARAWRSSR